MEKNADASGLLDQLGKLPAPLVFGLGLVLVILTGVIDVFENGFLRSLEFFYLIPIALVTWAMGGLAGAVISLVCAGIYLAAGLYAGYPFFPNPSIVLWNAAFRLGIFLLVAFLIASLRSRIQAGRKLATTDALTGALNNRAFYEAVRTELDRARRYRHPFTLVYMDLDRFKEINDSFGHSIGDAVLRTVSRTVAGHIRVVDVLARLGGDEFAVLLPETGGPEAEAVVPRLQQVVQQEMERGQWPTGVSVGATIFRSQPRQVDDVIYMAERAMQRAKRSTASAIHITVYEEERAA